MYYRAPFDKAHGRRQSMQIDISKQGFFALLKATGRENLIKIDKKNWIYTASSDGILCVDNKEGWDQSSVWVDGLIAQCGMGMLHSWQSAGTASFKRLVKYAFEIMRECGYTKVLTTLAGQPNIRRPLIDIFNFKVIETFTNQRTRNVVEVLTGEVVYENYMLGK